MKRTTFKDFIDAINRFNDQETSMGSPAFVVYRKGGGMFTLYLMRIISDGSIEHLNTLVAGTKRQCISHLKTIELKPDPTKKITMVQCRRRLELSGVNFCKDFNQQPAQVIDVLTCWRRVTKYKAPRVSLTSMPLRRCSFILSDSAIEAAETTAKNNGFYTALKNVS